MSNNVFGKAVDEFKQRFVTDETELLFLTVETVNGAAVIDDGVLSPSIEFIASVNLNTGEFSKKKADSNGLFPMKKNAMAGSMILINSIFIISGAEKIFL